MAVPSGLSTGDNDNSHRIFQPVPNSTTTFFCSENHFRSHRSHRPRQSTALVKCLFSNFHNENRPTKSKQRRLRVAKLNASQKCFQHSSSERIPNVRCDASKKTHDASCQFKVNNNRVNNRKRKRDASVIPQSGRSHFLLKIISSFLFALNGIWDGNRLENNHRPPSKSPCVRWARVVASCMAICELKMPFLESSECIALYGSRRRRHRCHRHPFHSTMQIAMKS